MLRSAVRALQGHSGYLRRYSDEMASQSLQWHAALARPLLRPTHTFTRPTAAVTATISPLHSGSSRCAPTSLHNFVAGDAV